MTVSETPTLPELDQTGWQPVCALRHLAPERGAAALLGGHQVALFRLVDDRVLAVDQHDPFSDAFVMSRGIVGSRWVDDVEVPTVASPMYKQVFDLTTGRCLDSVGKTPVRDLPADLRTFPVRVVDDVVEVEIPVAP
ncbi:nitrite reductase small subunit NirD [Cellulomonas sp. H30R-01]|uniref:nitrite reductase small subunit NirD n=1 Tax=Cellulomonas sp. H30R-01 TaxID=2704467 RepID=UPI00138C08C0|nr:nitrite reductase small subunit NirD [Cellulomonas sp. H30R-01]QHT56377.1 nitrite reductase small subunit NirD [Cellulomonas sp. H30R-01]